MSVDFLRPVVERSKAGVPLSTLSADEHRLLTEAPSEEETLAGTRDGEEAQREITLERGATVGRYVIIARIGAGAMGVVYKAFDPELDRAVAIKLLLGDGSRKGALGRSRLQREAQAMARIAHPNVIPVHDVGTVGERVFLRWSWSTANRSVPG